MDEFLKGLLIVLGVIIVLGAAIALVTWVIIARFVLKNGKKTMDRVNREFERQEFSGFEDDFDRYFRRKDERK